MMESIKQTAENTPFNGINGLQALLISRFAPTAIRTATTMFRRHPVLFAAGAAIAFWAWKSRKSPSVSARTSPADLVH